MRLWAENREQIERILKVGVDQARTHEDAHRIASRLGVMRYLYVADQVRRSCPPTAHLLDIGGGYGQVSFFLQSWGFDVMVFEVRPHYEEILNRLDLPYVMRADGDLSCFANGTYDGVIEVAVLELIRDKQAFIRNALSLLKEGGLYFCFLFPNGKYWVTKMGIRGPNPYASPRTYTPQAVVKLFENEGFKLESAEQFQFLPMNTVKVNSLASLAWKFDRFLCRLPLIGSFANFHNLVFRKSA